MSESRMGYGASAGLYKQQREASELPSVRDAPVSVPSLEVLTAHLIGHLRDGVSEAEGILARLTGGLIQGIGDKSDSRKPHGLQPSLETALKLSKQLRKVQKEIATFV